MYSQLSIDELVERAQETTGEESNLLKRELARRFREGDGVEVNLAEADYWEKQTCAEQPDTPKCVKEEMETPELTDIEDAYKQMGAKELLRAYRNKEPWGIYYFAVQMAASGEAEHAFETLTELEDLLEQDLAGNNVQADLLAKVKVKKGQICESEPVLNLDKACECYEEAVLELGYVAAFRPLLTLYRRSNSVGSHEQELLPVLRRIEDVSDETRCLAASVYCELGRKSIGVPLYEEVAENKAAARELRIEAMWSLVQQDLQYLNWLSESSANGDGVATFVVAAQQGQDKAYEEAMRLFDLSRQQDSMLQDYAAAEIVKIQEIQEQERQEEEQRRQAEENQRFMEAQRRQEEMERRREERRQRFGWRSPWIFWPVTIILSGVAAILFMYVCGYPEFSEILGAFTGTGAEIEVLNDILTSVFSRRGAVVLFLIGGVAGASVYNLWFAKGKAYCYSVWNYLLSVLCALAGIVALYLAILLLVGVVYLIAKLILIAMLIGALILVAVIFGGNRNR